MFQSTDADALRATGIGEAGPFEYVAHGGMIFGFIFGGNYRTRMHVDRLHPELTSLPGPNGVLTTAHATAIGSALSSGPNALLSLTSAPMKAVLTAIYAATAHEGFNPNNY